MAEGQTNEQLHREQGHLRAHERTFSARCSRCGGAAEQGWANAGDANDADWWAKGSPICFDPVCRSGARLGG